MLMNARVEDKKPPRVPREQRDPEQWGSLWRDARPCPVCGHDSWCRRTQDGKMVMCRREGGGCWGPREDCNGQPYFLHYFPDGEPDWDLSKHQHAGQSSGGRANADRLYVVYHTLLSVLTLDD